MPSPKREKEREIMPLNPYEMLHSSRFYAPHACSACGALTQAMSKYCLSCRPSEDE